MSGHSIWHSIKHKKAKEDAKRGKIFTRCIRELATAARVGGPDPDMNPRLRTAIAAAKAANMPNDNIERAIRKGAGLEEGTAYEEITFEGYGPQGVAIIVEALTDNRNRTVAETRHVFDKYGGKMGEAGCVSWMFDKKGVLYVDKTAADEDRITEAALEAGAEDVKDEGASWMVTTAAADFETVRTAFDEKGIPYSDAEITMLPQTYVKLTGKDAEKMLRLMDYLEDLDDAQHVYANFDISDEEMEKLSA
jgi:YebC/PmpR family DNA-binding regulatory protein